MALKAFNEAEHTEHICSQPRPSHPKGFRRPKGWAGVFLFFFLFAILCISATFLNWLSVSLSAYTSFVNGLGQSISQMAAEPQVDAAPVNGPQMRVSNLSQFAFTNSVHPVHVFLKSPSLQLCINIWGIIRLTLKNETCS